jgi:PIN domain nuclease of toxin-antitoxin system
MRILLDTHLLLWSLSQPTKLSAQVRRQIDAAEVYASAASIWEISIKATLGKLDANPREVLDGIEPAGFSLLAVSGEHAARIAGLPMLHKDPFDRILIAQALVEPMVLLTNDEALCGYGPFVTLS